MRVAVLTQSAAFYTSPPPLLLTQRLYPLSHMLLYLQAHGKCRWTWRPEIPTDRRLREGSHVLRFHDDKHHSSLLTACSTGSLYILACNRAPVIEAAAGRPLLLVNGGPYMSQLESMTFRHPGFHFVRISSSPAPGGQGPMTAHTSAEKRHCSSCGVVEPSLHRSRSLCPRHLTSHFSSHDVGTKIPRMTDHTAHEIRGSRSPCAIDHPADSHEGNWQIRRRDRQDTE